MVEAIASLSCQALLAGAPTPLALLSEAGEVLACNAAWERHCGPRGDVLERVHEEDRGALSARCADALAATGPMAARARVVASEGRQVALRWTLWHAGEAMLWATVEIDREEDERKARILHDVFQQMDAVMWSCDQHGVLQVSEGNALLRAGLKPGQFVGQSIAAVHGEDSEVAGIVRRVLAGESIRSDSLTEHAHWFAHYTPLYGEHGEILGVQALALHVPNDLPLATQGDLLGQCVDSMPIVLWAFDTSGVCTIVRGGGLAQIDLGLEVGKRYDDLAGEDDELRRAFERALAGESVIMECAWREEILRTRYIPRKDAMNRVMGICAIAEDISEQRHVEERLREQLRVTQEQQKAIATLSSPIIEVWQDVLVVPLIGVLQADLAAHMMAELLNAVIEKRASFAILDFTGMESADTTTAQHLLQVIDAVGLLGCRGVVSGIRPSMAQTMVGLGLDLSQVQTMRSLKEALRWCMSPAARR